MKKMNLLLSGMALVILGSSLAFARPNVAGPHHGPRGPRMEGPRVQAEGPRQKWKAVMEKAPEDIKAAYKELRELRKDLRLELCKNAPDSAKVMEMFKKTEELHLKVREWQIQQILKGDAPKPELKGRGRRGGRRAMPAMRGPHGPAPYGAPMVPPHGCPCMAGAPRPMPLPAGPVPPTPGNQRQ